MQRCRVRSRAAGQAAPCRESHVSPGTCVWCFERMPAAGEQVPELAPLLPGLVNPIGVALGHEPIFDRRAVPADVEPHTCDWFGRFTCRICGRHRDSVEPAASLGTCGAKRGERKHS